MDVQQLQYFVATAECLNVSRAALRCHVAQPSLSQQIKRLEGYLGVRLFDRLGRGVALTDAGRALLPRARRILAEVREAEANLKREAACGDGTIAIGAIPTMAPYLLPPALGRLRAERPECEVAIREDFTEALVEALADNEIDCALLSTPLRHDLLEVEVLGEEELIVALSPSHASAGAGVLGLRDLRREPAVTLQEMHCLGRQIEGFCAARHVAPRVVCRTAQLATVFQLVSLGVGISVVPEMAAAADVAHCCRYGRLGGAAPRRQIAVAWRTGRTRPAAAVRFVQIVHEQLGRGTHSLGPDSRGRRGKYGIRQR